MLSLPVEFVAGGDGKPEPFPESLDSAPGLGGGSGNDGKLFGEETEPKKIADKGRDLDPNEGLGVIWKAKEPRFWPPN